MTDLVCIAFAEATHADQALEDLQRIREEVCTDLPEAAAIVYGEDGRIAIKQTAILTPAGHLSGSNTTHWPSLMKVLFLHSAAGLVPKAETAMTAQADRLCAETIPETFLDGVSNSVKPGGSALFLMDRGGPLGDTEDRLAAYRDRPASVIRAEISPAALDALESQLKQGGELPGERAALRRPTPPKAPVDRASDDGFPASDPPSFVPGTPGRPD